MAVHSCACPCCRGVHSVTPSLLPCGAACTLGAAVARKNPMAGAVIAVLGVVFHRELDQFFRYRCPQCGAALEILATLA